MRRCRGRSTCGWRSWAARAAGGCAAPCWRPGERGHEGDRACVCSWDMGAESELLHDSVSLVYPVLWVQSTLLITQMGLLGQGLPHLQVFGTYILRFSESRVGAMGACRYFGRLLVNSPSPRQGFGQEGPEWCLRPVCPPALQREDAGEHRECGFSHAQPARGAGGINPRGTQSHPCPPASPAWCP